VLIVKTYTRDAEVVGSIPTGSILLFLLLGSNN